MNQETQILNWLVIGISQSPYSLNESFYFDKLNNEFFSIIITDYFMLDENLNMAKNTSSSYTSNNQNELVNRINRIENKDVYIVSIPHLTSKERKELLNQFLESIDDPREKERIQQLSLNRERTTFDKKFDIESTQEIVEGWNNYKNRILLSKAESFLNLNKVNIDVACIWIPGEDGSITIDLTKDEKGNEVKVKSKWWKFWKKKN